MLIGLMQTLDISVLCHHCGSVDTWSSGIVDRILYHGDSMFLYYFELGLIPNEPYNYVYIHVVQYFV